MTPNILKGNKDTSKFVADVPDHVKAQANDVKGGGMDSDHNAKTLDTAATSTSAASDLTEGLHETGKQIDPQGAKATGHGTSIFSQDGAVGQNFTSQGAIGGTAESIGGPLASDGAIGKQFTTSGAVGGTFQKLAEGNERH